MKERPTYQVYHIGSGSEPGIDQRRAQEEAHKVIWQLPPYDRMELRVDPEEPKPLFPHAFNVGHIIQEARKAVVRKVRG